MRLRRAAVVAGLALLGATPALAQPAQAPAPAPARQPVFTPRVDVGVVYDDNLFSQPNASFDTILRISPTLAIFRETQVHTFSTQYSFDAERYQDFKDLSSPFVRQNASANWTARPNPRTTVGLLGDYWRTQTPTDLNLTTGLVAVRQLATQWSAGTEITRVFTPRTSFLVGYRFSQSDLADVGAVDTATQTGNARLTRRVNPRTDLRLAYVGEHWSFTPGDTEFSHLGTIGFTRQLTDATSLTMDGGPRFAAGLLRPELTATLARRVAERVDLSLAYAHSQSIAIGVAGLIEVDSVQAAATWRHPQVWEVRLAGGGFRNVLSGTEVQAFDAEVEISRALGAGLWFVAHGSATFNTRVATGDVPDEQQIRRNVFGVSLRVDPWSPR